MSFFNIGKSQYEPVHTIYNPIPEDKTSSSSSSSSSFFSKWFSGSNDSNDAQVSTVPIQSSLPTDDPETQSAYAYQCEHGIGVEKSYAEAIKWYSKAAKRGHAKALFSLVDMYLNGKCRSRLLSRKKVEMYEMAAEQGHVGCLPELGKIYQFGLFVPRDYQRALDYFKRAFEKGVEDAESAYSIGLLYRAGKGVDSDQVQALTWFEEAAALGHSQGHYEAGMIYLSNVKLRDYSKAFLHFKESAALKNPYGINGLGMMYFYGWGRNLDKEKAFDLFLKAAEQSHAEACFNTAYCYLKGVGVSKNEAEAKKYFNLASEKNFAKAFYYKSRMYYDGTGCKANHFLARGVALAGAKRGDLDCQEFLGDLYANGYGGAKSSSKAIDWYRKAANKGKASAQLKLGLHLFSPSQKDTSRSREGYNYILKSAKKGNASAQYELARIFESTGRPGSQPSCQKAAIWYQKAADQGHKAASEALQ